MIKSIFAVDCWGGMGFRGSLPWGRHREDLQYFKQQTEDQVVVLGRKTWDDPLMPKPLPNRISYVATNRQLDGFHTKTIRGNLKERILELEKLYPNKTIWIIGGSKLLMETRDIVSEVHITHFKGQYTTDTRINLREYLHPFRVCTAKPAEDHQISWMVYRNIDKYPF